MAANMSIDAWAKVFKFLEPSPESHNLPSCCLQYRDAIQPQDQEDASGPSRMQATFWRLPAVCKTFQSVHKECSRLGCHVFSDTKLARQPLFLGWLQLQAAKVHSSSVVCEPNHTAECLRALLHSSSVLASISLTAQVLPELGLLAQFTSLTACSFTHSPARKYSEVDLAPLTELPNLTSLSLQARCVGLWRLGHLTYLDLDRAYLFDDGYDENHNVVTYDQTALPFRSLIELQLKNSRLWVKGAGLHSCERLEKLVLLATKKLCEFECDDTVDTFKHCPFWPAHYAARSGAQIPYRISYLEHMTDLQLHLPGGGQEIDLTGICDLPSLKSLDIVGHCRPWRTRDLLYV